MQIINSVDFKTQYSLTFLQNFSIFLVSYRVFQPPLVPRQIHMIIVDPEFEIQKLGSMYIWILLI